MIRTLIRTAWANARSRPLQSSLTALIVFAAAATLTLALNVRAGSDEPFERNFRATDAGHVYAFTRAENVDLRPLAHQPGVRRVAGPIPIVDAAPVVNGRERDLELDGVSATPPAFDRPQVTSGRWVRSGAHELVLEHSFARHRNVHVGDVLAFPRPGRSAVRLRVVGIAITASQGPDTDWSPSTGWVPAEVLRAEAPPAKLRERLVLQLHDRNDSAAFMDRARRMFSAQDAGFYDWRDVRDSVTSRTDTSSAVLQASSLLALLSVGLIIANAIAGRVLAQRREIGIQKAIGFTPRDVTATLLVEHVGLAALAAVLGTAVGVAMSPLLLRPTARLLQTPTPDPLQASALALGIGGIVAVVAAFTALPAWRAGRLEAVSAISGTRGVREPKRSVLARVAATLHLPPAVVVGVKDAFARRTRALLTIGSLALTVAIVASALGTEATFKRVISDSSLRAKPYDVLVDQGSLTNAQTERVLAGQGSRIRHTYTLSTLPAEVIGRGAGHRDITTRALGGDYRAFPYAVRNGRQIAGPGEAIVGRGLLDDFHLHVGDRLTLRVDQQPISLRIVGRYVEPDDQARTAMYSLDSLPPASAARARRSADYGLDLAPGVDAHAVSGALIQASGGRLDAEATSDEIKGERADVRPVMYGTELLMLAIGLVNLLTTLLLAVRERDRDFGILKVLGLTPRQVLVAVTAGGVLLALLAIVIGTPIGLAVFRTLVVELNPTDGPDVVTVPPWWWIALLVPGALALTTLASVLPARRAAAIKPGEVLRYE